MLRTIIFLLRLLREIPAGGEGSGFAESVGTTARGTDYDWYEPAGASAKTFILVSGLTMRGHRDPRLVNFARAMALSGVRAAAVASPGLMSGRFEERDVDAISDLARELAAESGGPVGVVAFSAGAGLALAAAARPELIGRLDPLILFGAYYSLPALLTEMGRQMRGTPSGPTAEDDYIWLLMWSAYADLDNMSFSEQERRELIQILRDYCTGPTPEEKREFFNRVLQDRLPQIQKAADERHRAQSPEALDRLSPEGKLEKITARVFLLHDLHDSLIPPEHARQILAELTRQSAPSTHQLLVTPLLSHVNARAALRVGDLFRMLRIMGEIFR